MGKALGGMFGRRGAGFGTMGGLSIILWGGVGRGGRWRARERERCLTIGRAPCKCACLQSYNKDTSALRLCSK